MNDKTMIFKKLEENRGKLLGYGVKRLGLFGSYVRGEQTAKSDLDMLVEFIPGKKTYENLFGLHEYLEELFGKKTDLVTPEGLSQYIAPYIYKDIQYEQIS